MPEVSLIMFIMFMSALGAAAMFAIFLMLLTFMTPAWSFFRARFKHRPLVMTFRRDGKAEFVTTEEYEPGLVKTKYGGFLIDEDSPYSEKKSNVTILLASAEHGVTKSVEWLQLKAAMKQSGLDSITDAYAAEMAYHGCKDCGYVGMMKLIEDDDGNRSFVCPNEILKEEVNETEKEAPLYVSAKDRDAAETNAVHVDEPAEDAPAAEHDNKDAEHA